MSPALCDGAIVLRSSPERVVPGLVSQTFEKKGADMLHGCGLRAYPDKSIFGPDVIEDLGHNLSMLGISPHQSLVESVTRHKHNARETSSAQTLPPEELYESRWLRQAGRFCQILSRKVDLIRHCIWSSRLRCYHTTSPVPCSGLPPPLLQHTAYTRARLIEVKESIVG